MTRQKTMSVRLMGPKDADLTDEQHEEGVTDFDRLCNEAEATISDGLPEGWYVKFEEA